MLLVQLVFLGQLVLLDQLAPPDRSALLDLLVSQELRVLLVQLDTLVLMVSFHIQILIHNTVDYANILINFHQKISEIIYCNVRFCCWHLLLCKSQLGLPVFISY